MLNNSKCRCDGLCVYLEQRLTNDPNTSEQCYKSCVSSDTSKTHIDAFLSTKGTTHTEKPVQKRLSDQLNKYLTLQSIVYFVGKDVPIRTQNIQTEALEELLNI